MVKTLYSILHRSLDLTLLLQELLSEVQNLCLKECWCGNSNQKNVIIEKKT